jgi:hypothetical protein
MTRFRSLLLTIALCVAAAASAQVSIISINPGVLPLEGGTISVRTAGWASSECGNICNLDVFIGGEKLPRSAIHFFGLTLTVNVPAQTRSGVARFELHHPFGAPVIVENALLFVEDDDYETVLLPLIGNTHTPIPGAFGSQWKTATWVSNQSAHSFRIAVPFDDPGLIGPSPGPFQHVIVPAQSASRLEVALTGPVVVRVPRALANDVAFQTRAYDDSRGELNFGTRVPSVRPSEFHRSRITIADVPTAPPFRASLRIYSPDQQPRAFHVTLSTQPDIVATPSVELTLPPASIVLTQFTAATAVPFHLAIYDASKPYAVPFADILLPTLAERFQVSVEPVDDGDAPFYAFVSVTNNSTQHVTLLTPH